MRCPKCDWTTVSFELESRRWQCKRCHATFSDDGGRSWLGAAEPPSRPPRTPHPKSPVKSARGARAKGGVRGKTGKGKASAAPRKSSRRMSR